MSASDLQEPFLKELAETFIATSQRISDRLDLTSSVLQRDAIIREELSGLYHGVLVIFDGGTALADRGLVRIVDDNGVEFDRHLHEICLKYWPKASR